MGESSARSRAARRQHTHQDHLHKCDPGRFAELHLLSCTSSTACAHHRIVGFGSSSDLSYGYSKILLDKPSAVPITCIGAAFNLTCTDL
uniref:Uncharacterized protein n=1 Tax=Pfiesteria piscicida TaxID=71001 RepID=A3E3S7_PFIPI|nr:unknown [Pfiesteria piscicida]